MAIRPQSPNRLSRAEQLAARDAASREAFVREVDDALREDEVFTTFRRNAVPVGAAIVLGLAALAGGLWYNNHRQAVKEQHSEQLVLALDKLDGASPQGAFPQLAALAKESDDGTGTVARLLQAAIAARQGNAATATALYGQVIADSDAPKPFRDLATVRDVALRFDTMKPEDAVARLRPLAAPGNPWFGSAGELLAAAYLRQNRKDLAGPLLVAIARDKTLPDSLRARTRQLAGLLGFDAIDDIARPTAEEPAPQPGAPGPQPMSGPQPVPGQVPPGAQAQPPGPAQLQPRPAPPPQASKAELAARARAAASQPITVNLPGATGGSPAPAPKINLPAPAAPATPASQP